MNEEIVPALGFDILTPCFDLACSVIGYGKPLKDRVIRASGFKYGESLLDVGCGTGTLVMMAKSQHPTSRVVGIDPDDKILRIARRKLTHGYGLDVKLVKSGAEQLPFPDESFDVVVSSLTFHHLPTVIKKQAMQEINRVLKHNGRFLLADFGPTKSITARLLFGLAKVLQLEESKYLQDNLQGKLPSFLQEAGFAVKEVVPTYRGVRFLLATK